MSLEGLFSNIQRAIGEHLRELRIAKGSSQDQLAQQIGVSVQAVRNWESGRHQPTSYHIRQLANYYGIAPVQLVAQIQGVASGLGELSVSVSITGLLLSGEDEHPASAQSGTVNIPELVSQEHPKVFGLVVRGDSLATHGIADGDLVLVDPESESTEGGVDVVSKDGFLFARFVESIQEISDQPTSIDDADRIGKVVWHLRKM